MRLVALLAICSACAAPARQPSAPVPTVPYDDGRGDRDGDRLLDANDNCPNEPETYNGIEDEDGCPDHERVQIQTCDLPIIERIYFRPRSTQIPQPLARIVDTLAEMIVANPDFRQIAVIGHASLDERDPGPLSIARARIVLEAFVRRGVPSDRLVAIGRGASTPLDPARTERARAKNRRVELEVLERASAPPP